MSWPLPGTDGAAAKRQQGAHTIKVHTLTGRVKGSNVILHVTHGEVPDVSKKKKKRSRCRHMAKTTLRAPLSGTFLLEGRML